MADDIQDLGTEPKILTLRPNWAEPLTMSTTLNREILQSIPGAAQIDYVVGETQAFPSTFEMKFTNLTKEDEYTLLDFFEDRQGRLKRFWCPHWYKSFIVMGAAAPPSSGFNVEYSGFRDVWLRWPDKYQRFVIVMNNGDIIVRRLFNIQDMGTYDLWLYQTQITAHTIKDSDIAFFSVCPLVRFDIDTLDMEHRTADTSSCTVRVTELIGEYNNVGK